MQKSKKTAKIPQPQPQVPERKARRVRTNSRPQWLVVITRPRGEMELFSAHHIEDEARCMADRLVNITAGCVISVIRVPDSAGVFPMVKSVNEQPAPAIPDLPPAPQAKPKPFRKLSQAEFQAETDAMMKGGVSDTPEPEYQDATS